MKRSFNSKARKQINFKKTDTLADRKKVSSLSLTDAYEIAGGYKNADEKTFVAAMRMVERDDRDFAEKLKNTADRKQRPSLKKLLTLNEAYEIAGGYKSASRIDFEKAMTLIEADDPFFAASLREMHKEENRKNVSKTDDLTKKAETIAANTEYMRHVFEEDKKSNELKNDVMSDEEVSEAIRNTPVAGVASQTSEDTTSAVYENSTADALHTLAENEDFAQADEAVKNEILRTEVKKSLLHTIKHLRLSNLFGKNEEEHIKAIKEDNETFFAKRISDIRSAFNFKKKVNISGMSVASVFENTNKKLSDFAKKLTDSAKQAGTNAKVKKLLSQAAISVRKTMVTFAMTSMVVAPVLTSCGNASRQNVPQENGGVGKRDTTQLNIKKAPVQQTAEENVKILVPTAWAEGMSITQKQFDHNRAYWGDKYDEFYQAIPQSIVDSTGKSRELILFQYERMCSWNLAQHRQTIEKLNQFFNCGQKISAEDFKMLNDVMSDGSIKNVTGTECLRTDSIRYDCETGKMTRFDVKLNCGCDENVQQTLSDSLVTSTGITSDSTSTQTPTPADSLENINFTEVKGQTITVNRQRTQTEVTRLSDMEVRKANGVSDNGLVIGTTSPKNAMNVKASPINVVTEQTKQSKAALVSNQEITFEEVPGTTIEVNNLQNLAGAEIKSNVVETPATKGEITFDEIPGTTIEINGQNKFREEAPLSADTTTVIDSVVPYAGAAIKSDTTATQIVQNSDDLPAGTPAANNVSERGGYQNSGLSEKQHKETETFYKNRFGENAFNDFMERFPDDLRTKGSAFEGLSKAQSLYALQKMIQWSTNKSGKLIGQFADESIIVLDYLKECKDTITVSDAATVKTAVDKVRNNGSMKGVIGHNRNMVFRYETGDCGEKGNAKVNLIQGRAETPLSEKGFPRFFKKFIVSAPEPEFDEIDGGCQVVYVEKTEKKFVEPKITIIKANNLSAGKVLGSSDAASVVKTVNENTDKFDINVVIEEGKVASQSVSDTQATVIQSNNLNKGKDIGSTDATTIVSSVQASESGYNTKVVTKKKAKKQRAKEVVNNGLSQEAQKDLEKRGISTKNVNPALAHWVNEAVSQR